MWPKQQHRKLRRSNITDVAKTTTQKTPHPCCCSYLVFCVVVLATSVLLLLFSFLCCCFGHIRVVTPFSDVAKTTTQKTKKE
jgi:hypothetical protein